jgi:uncharacterized membrane protein YcgQ (UPF0703/DUF1980 family)
MKKNVFLGVIFGLIFSFLLMSCNKDEKTGGQRNIVEIGERMFASQVNDVYLNTKDYLGKTIKLEGLFKAGEYEDDYYYVIRYGPGSCCGVDLVGFEVCWKANQSKPYPEEDDWVEAIGVLKTFDEGFQSYPYLELASLTVLDKRGAEYVFQ